MFDIPSHITRVHIRGTWSGTGTSNFIVRIGGRVVVNAILRELPSRTYEGTHLISAGGGVAEISSSANISSWTFTEVR